MHEIIYKLKLLLEREVQSLHNEIEFKRELLTEIKTYCRNNCTHKWIDDLIDIDPDTTKRIIYCEKCELNK